MSYSQTPNLGLLKPLPNSDNGTWGYHLNSNADLLDSVLATAPGSTGALFLPLAGGTVTGPVILAGDPFVPLGAATKQYVDAHAGTGGGGIAEAPSDGNAYGRKNAAWQRVLPLSGATLTGPLILATDPATALGAATKQYVDARGGVAEAPSDGTVYGRNNAAWARALPLAGGTLIGPLLLAANATANLGAVTLQQMNAAVVSAPTGLKVLHADGATYALPGTTTESGLVQYTVAANTLAKNGDRLVITCGGTLAGGSGYNLYARLYLSSIIAVANAPNTNANSWWCKAEIIRSGTLAQTCISTSGMGNGSGAGGVSDALVTSASLDPTGTMLVSVSGQNATSAAAGSMSCRFFTVEYIPS